MANGPNFQDTVPLLRQVPELDTGVHLNITLGLPLTSKMREYLIDFNGDLQNAAKTSRLIFQKKIPVTAIVEEWRSQIKRCIASGLTIGFINSHEHVHLLPHLYDAYIELAREFHIPYKRHTQPEWYFLFDVKSIFRNMVFHSMLILNRGNKSSKDVKLIGTGLSCNLNIEYIEACLNRMKEGRVYELMVHPGYFNSHEIKDQRLVRYHSWVKELQLLLGEPLFNLLREYNVKLISYKEIKSIKAD